MEEWQEVAYAKINLALHVRVREPDGYHRIETIFAFAEDGDRLVAGSASDLTLETTGPFAPDIGADEDNLVLRAARALRDRHRIEAGAVLTLYKRLPVSSGIGGGSAEAAAALRLLGRLWGIGTDPIGMSAIARELGSDVPACLASTTARGEGRGELLSPLDLGLTGTPLLLVNPGVPVETGAVFRAWDGLDRGPLGELPGRNDLEAPAMALAPVIGDALARLRSASGATLVRMSGSGATCFALFESERQRDEARDSIAGDQPGWWVMASRLR